MSPPQVLWDVLSGNAICGSPCSTNTTNCVKFFNNSSDRLLTAGNYNLNMWTYDGVNNKLRPTEATLGTLKRVFRTVSIDASDTYAYCGTTTGDVLQVGRGCIGLSNEDTRERWEGRGAGAGCSVVSHRRCA